MYITFTIAIIIACELRRCALEKVGGDPPSVMLCWFSLLVIVFPGGNGNTNCVCACSMAPQ